MSEKLTSFKMKSLLKNAREQKGLKTTEVARLLSIDKALISKFESGQRIPTETQIQNLAKLLDIDLAILMVAWYKEKLLHILDFNTYSIQAVTEILSEKGIKIAQEDKKELQLADILSEIDNLKNKLSNL
ncbi:hypothetical protein FCR2A7T_26920 [Flavobacterium cauense R2A-7]|nr:hypothetical protein FCR2A7T_26920 [Flavobacterium cauense R2A-7]